MKKQQKEISVLVIDANQAVHNYNYCLLEALSQKSEHIIYATTKYPYEDVPPPKGIKVRYCFFYLARAATVLTRSPLVRRLLRGIEYPLDILMLMFYILAKRIDVVHVMFSLFPRFDVFYIKLLQKMGCKVVFTAHNPFPHEEKASNLRNYSRLYRQVDAIIALTRFTRDQIVAKAEIPSEKISIIPHGDFDYIFSKYDTNETLAEKVKIKAASQPVVSFLGIIRPYKGLEYFIKAFELIKEQVPNCFFLVAGSMLIGDKDELQDLLTTSCEPEDLWADIRYLPIPDMKAYLSATDILVQPYISASQSGNTVMAYKAGVPVISTDVGGLAEMTIDGQTGYVIPPKEPQAIANAIAKCLENNKLKEMSKKAREIAAEQYSWDTIAADTIKEYQMFAKEK